jgi:hypothetical protein
MAHGYRHLGGCGGHELADDAAGAGGPGLARGQLLEQRQLEVGADAHDT